MDFEDLERDVAGAWETYTGGEFPRELFRRLCRANQACCSANMGVIAERKYAVPDTHVISELERTARRVGEVRVKTRGEINSTLAVQLGGTGEPEARDIVMSVGDLLDRLSIEVVKAQVFGAGLEADAKRTQSRRLAAAARQCYVDALARARRQGYYHGYTEARTYA